MIDFRSLHSVPTLSTADEHPYLGSSKSIPHKCHLFVVPGTIVNQWASEIRIFLNPKAFDLFIYVSRQDFRDDFWSESGPFTRSNQPGANRIILATHSVSRCHFDLSGGLFFLCRRSHRIINFFFATLRLRRRDYPGINRNPSHCTTQL